MTANTLQELTSRNLRIFRERYVSEISGSLGDLGTFLPIAIALSISGAVSLSSTLIFSGLFNILTGALFGIPLPVQPMKAIAAVGIARSFTKSDITAAGLFVSACILLFSVSGLLRWFANVIPIPVVKGIQVGAGLSLVISSSGSLLASLRWTSPSWADNLFWAGLAFLFLLVTNVYRKVPYALIVFVVGLVFAVIRSVLENFHHHHHHHGHLPSPSLWHPFLVIPQGHEWRVGALDAGLGQIPLTTLNSIVAVVHLAGDLLPTVRVPSVTSIGLSVAGMNLIGCWFGAMPVCHGSGGLAAQYRFGARSGASVIFLGLVKLIVGLFFGESLLGLLHRFPMALLGVLVIAAGMELASVGESLNTPRARDLGHIASLTQNMPSTPIVVSEEESKKRFVVMITTTAMLVGFKNDAIGFLAGMLSHWIYQLPRVDWEAIRDRMIHRRRVQL